jgi:Zn ribbon nucleic-acid-binding protein
MKKIPKFLFAASIAMLTSASSCDKLIMPAFEQIDSCKECGFNSESILKGVKVKLNYNSQVEE